MSYIAGPNTHSIPQFWKSSGSLFNILFTDLSIFRCIPQLALIAYVTVTSLTLNKGRKKAKRRREWVSVPSTDSALQYWHSQCWSWDHNPGFQVSLLCPRVCLGRMWNQTGQLAVDRSTLKGVWASSQAKSPSPSFHVASASSEMWLSYASFLVFIFNSYVHKLFEMFSINLFATVFQPMWWWFKNLLYSFFIL